MSCSDDFVNGTSTIIIEVSERRIEINFELIASPAILLSLSL